MASSSESSASDDYLARLNLGHVGFSLVPWKARLGAVALLLPELKAKGLPYIEITTDPTNAASPRVIQANGGVLVGTFPKPMSHV